MVMFMINYVVLIVSTYLKRLTVMMFCEFILCFAKYTLSVFRPHVCLWSVCLCPKALFKPLRCFKIIKNNVPDFTCFVMSGDVIANVTFSRWVAAAIVTFVGFCNKAVSIHFM